MRGFFFPDRGSKLSALFRLFRCLSLPSSLRALCVVCVHMGRWCNVDDVVSGSLSSGDVCTSLSPLLAAFRPPGQVGRARGRAVWGWLGRGEGGRWRMGCYSACLSGWLTVRKCNGMAWKRPSQREIEGRQADRGCSSRSRSSSSSSLHACIACIDACVHACNCNLACYLLFCSHVWGRGR